MMARPILVKGRYLLDGEIAYRLRCPGCQEIKIADDDQFHGRVSIQCDCGYHETHNLSSE